MGNFTRYVVVFLVIAVVGTSQCTLVPDKDQSLLLAKTSATFGKMLEDKLNIRGRSSTRHDRPQLRMETNESQTTDYILCRTFLKTELCNKCFPEHTNRTRASTDHSTLDVTRTSNDITMATPLPEFAYITSVVMTRLLEGNCEIPRSARRRRRVETVWDVDGMEFIQSIYKKYGSSGIMNNSEFDTLLKDLGIGEPLSAKKAGLHPSTTGSNHSDIQQCFLASDLAAIFNASDGIPEAMFAEICPSLIQQITEGCLPEAPHTLPLDPKTFGWATLAVTTITLLSMLAMTAVPTHGSRFYASVMQLFIGLAVSSLSGDALLHLLPEAVGIHDMHVEVGQPNHILITLTVILAVYFFFIFERVLSLCLKGKSYGHGHVHSRPRRETFPEENTPVQKEEIKVVIKDEDDKQSDVTQDRTQVDTDQPSHHHQLEKKSSTAKLVVEQEAGLQDNTQHSQDTICGLNMLSVMVMLGDAVHNITDGITIGVSFAKDPFIGISTTIAVLFHEIPHEIGDFAVMLRSGISFKRAMLYSLLSNLTGFAGLYAGVLLGSDNTVQRWIFAATAGMFLYIALVSLVPEMNQQAEEAEGSQWMVFLRHNIGLLLGWAIMLLIGMYEQYAEH